MSSHSDRSLITAYEAAHLFGLSPATVRKWVERYGLKHVGKKGRAYQYREADIRRLAVRVVRRHRDHVTGRYARR